MLANYLLMNLFGFVVGIISGISLLASRDQPLAGFGGSPLEQVLWYGIGMVFYFTLVLGIPVLLLALLVWRMACRLVGHPRMTAFGLAGLTVVILAAVFPQMGPMDLAIALGLLLTFAALVRLPPGRPSPSLDLA